MTLSEDKVHGKKKIKKNKNIHKVKKDLDQSLPPGLQGLYKSVVQDSAET